MVLVEAAVEVVVVAGCCAGLIGLFAVTHSLHRREAAGSIHCFFENAAFSFLSSHALHTLPVDSVMLEFFSGLAGSVMARRAEGGEGDSKLLKATARVSNGIQNDREQLDAREM